MLVYLDTCAIQRPLDDRNQLRVRVEADVVVAVFAAAEAGAIQLVASDVLRFESENNPIPARRDFARRVLAMCKEDVATTAEVGSLARRYRAAGIKPIDAVHLASAVVAKADFFCTVDDEILRKARRANTESTRVVSPSELITELTP